MKKIISLFKRNYETDYLVRDEIVEGAEWVANGEGLATRKVDGSCCMIRSGKLYRRYELKKGRQQPPDFEPTQEPDPVTGEQPGWIPIGDGPEDKWFRAALKGNEPDGTYELLGPKVNGNPEKFNEHILMIHGAILLPDAPRSFSGLKEWLRDKDIEGIVWHHPDGRMVKIKKRDFWRRR